MAPMNHGCPQVHGINFTNLSCGLVYMTSILMFLTYQRGCVLSNPTNNEKGMIAGLQNKSHIDREDGKDSDDLYAYVRTV